MLDRRAAATTATAPTRIAANTPQRIARLRFMGVPSLLHRRIFQSHAVTRAQTLGHQDAVAAPALHLDHSLLKFRTLPHVGHGLPRFLKRSFHRNGEGI